MMMMDEMVSSCDDTWIPSPRCSHYAQDCIVDWNGQSIEVTECRELREMALFVKKNYSIKLLFELSSHIDFVLID
jgi:hypothetical protein